MKRERMQRFIEGLNPESEGDWAELVNTYRVTRTETLEVKEGRNAPALRPPTIN